MGYVMNHAIRALKNDPIVSRSFMSGQKPEHIEKLLQEAHHNNLFKTKTMFWDGAAWDAHQSAQIISLIDVFILNEMLPILCDRLNICGMKKLLVLKNATELYTKIYSRKKNKQFMSFLISGGIFGTVFSGHPTRTTFGNTMRNIVINLTLLRKTTINVDNYYLPVSLYN